MKLASCHLLAAICSW